MACMTKRPHFAAKSLNFHSHTKKSWRISGGSSSFFKSQISHACVKVSLGQNTSYFQGHRKNAIDQSNSTEVRSILLTFTKQYVDLGIVKDAHSLKKEKTMEIVKLLKYDKLRLNSSQKI